MRSKTYIWLTVGISLLVPTLAVSDLFDSHSNIKNPPVIKRSIPKNSLPNIFIMETPRTKKTDFSIWKEILPIIKDVTWNKTGRNHEQKFYDGLFNGAYKRKPDDILVLFFSLDTEARIPPKYEDLLPKPWSEIEISLITRRAEFRGLARG